VLHRMSGNMKLLNRMSDNLMGRDLTSDRRHKRGG